MKDCNSYSGFMCDDWTFLPSTLQINKVSPRGLGKKTHPTIMLHVIVISIREHLSWGDVEGR